jgi:pyruvate dehydrogenase E2 component (dihydrolipoamide acetyltransferase)
MAEKIAMPKLGFDMAEGTLIRWVKSEGEAITKGDVLAEIETDKATVEVEAQSAGFMKKHIIQEGTVVPVGQVIAIIGEENEEIDYDSLLETESPQAEAQGEVPSPEKIVSEPTVPTAESKGQFPGGVKATPMARKLAKDLGIDLRMVVGTGQGGRIVKHDVEEAMTGTGAGISPAIEVPVSDTFPKVTEPSIPLQGTIEIPISRLRSIIGKRMTTAKQVIPHFYLTGEYDAGPMMDLRQELNNRLPDDDKFSVNDFIVKATALALRQFPNLNATLHDDKILRHGEINIGIAVAVDDGLLTVVIRNADQKSLRAISNSTRTAISRAREGRVRSEDVEGSTFTVSNLGMFDIENFIAIINPPEAAILAIGSVVDVPVIKEGEIIPGKKFKATLSADHRITDGAEAARWMQVFKGMIEDPLKLLIE